CRSSAYRNWLLSPPFPKLFGQSQRQPFSLRPDRRHARRETLDFVRQPFPAIGEQRISNHKPPPHHVPTGFEHPVLARLNPHAARTQFSSNGFHAPTHVGRPTRPHCPIDAIALPGFGDAPHCPLRRIGCDTSSPQVNRELSSPLSQSLLANVY